MWSDFPKRSSDDHGATPLPDHTAGFRTGPCEGQAQLITLAFTHANAALVDHREPNAKVRWETNFRGPHAAGITNGTVTLCVNQYGALHEGGCTPSSGDGTTDVGLRYRPTGAEGLAHVDTEQDCPCEGWGVRAILPEGKGSYSGWVRGPWIAGVDSTAGVTPVSFTSTGSTARSVVRIDSTAGLGPLEVTQEFYAHTAHHPGTPLRSRLHAFRARFPVATASSSA